MTWMRGRARVVLAGLRALLVLGVVVWATRAPEPVAASAAWPSPEELDSLSAYLAPAVAAPNIDEYAAYLPADDAPVVRQEYRPRRPAIEAPDRKLSAILITPDRPIAIIDNQQVRPGEQLPGGAEVLAIEKDQVIVREADGTRRTLRVSPVVTEGME